MYESFYGFTEKPFSIVPNPAYLFMSEKHANALTYLEYGISEHTGFILLTGEIGAGKTTLIRYLFNKLLSDYETAEIFNTNVDGDQLMRLVLQEFGIPPAEGKTENLDRLHQFLIEKYAAGKEIMLIIDEAQNLSNEALEEVRMLSNLQTDDRTLMQILLVGQPNLKVRLLDPGLYQMAQRIAVSYHLPPLERFETEKYVFHRLQVVGGSEDLFTESAIDLIHEKSGGIPRTINLLCDACLVYGYADEMTAIDRPVVEAVIQDKGDVGLTPQGERNVSGAVAGDRADEIFEKLDRLESKLEELESRIELQVDELRGQLDSSRKEMEQLLQRLVGAERKRSDMLLLRYNRLKDKYETLLNGGSGTDVDDAFVF
jgi:putative secretion ATPase (PEP-CTERM system associated)